MCRLFTEVAKILHQSCATQERTVGSDIGIQSLCFKNPSPRKIKKSLLPLALRTKQDLERITSILRNCKSLKSDEILRRGEKFWLYASFLCECLNRRTSKRLQKSCPLLKMERELQKLAQYYFNSSPETIISNLNQDKDVFNANSDHEGGFFFMRAVKTAEMANVNCFQVLLQQQGFTQKLVREVDSENENKKDHSLLISCMKALEPHEFILDPVIRGLFIFSNGSNFKSCSLFSKGLFYSQDRASCVVSKVLSPPRGAVVLETCAAPGSKTTHIASQFLRKAGKVFAVERSKDRLETLEAAVKKFELCNVEVINEDFLSLDPQDPKFAEVEYISCDPSCSGSGMIGARSISHSQFSEERKNLLKKFQCKILRRALKFPRVHTVVYSTCSIFKEENEDVIADVLSSVPNWNVAPLPEHYSSSRGIADTDHPDIAPHCLRFSPIEDLTNGFFICKLTRDCES